MKNLKCPNADCTCRRDGREARIATHGFYKTRSARRRRYRCLACNTTFSSTKGTAYYRLQHGRSLFDDVANLSVEGVNKSAISRVKGIAWNTVHRWLERAGELCRKFNDKHIRGFELSELQVDEIRTISGGRKQPIWIFAAIEVGSRLWPTTVVGRRSYQNTATLLEDVRMRSESANKPMIMADGFEFYERAVDQVFGIRCLFGRVMKTRRENRVVRVERRVSCGTSEELEEALENSEDSETINTSFVERLNLMLRQMTAYLTRRAACHSRRKEQLENQLEIARSFYNFMRPHRALKFGRLVKTPAMQADLTNRRLSFWEIFLLFASVIQNTLRSALMMTRMVAPAEVSLWSLHLIAEAPNIAILAAMGFFTRTRRHLEVSIEKYTKFYNEFRNHQGVGNELLTAREFAEDGPIECQSELGGMLNFYCRKAA